MNGRGLTIHQNVARVPRAGSACQFGCLRIPWRCPRRVVIGHGVRLRRRNPVYFGLSLTTNGLKLSNSPPAQSCCELTTVRRRTPSGNSCCDALPYTRPTFYSPA